MRRQRATLHSIRRRLLAGASALAMRVALRPWGWASGLLAVGLLGAPALALAQVTIDLATEADVVIQGANAYDRSERSGSSVSGAGDVNGDGLDDLIIGAPDASRSYGCPVQSGASYVVFGAEALPTTVDLADLGDGGDGFILRGSSLDDKCSGERSGSSVSGAGDVNGDGLDDLIVGAPNHDLNGVGYVVFGTEDPLSASIDFDDFFPGDGSEGFVLFGAYNAYGIPSVYTGASVSGAGDVNGDGFDDVIIGAPNIDARGDYSYSGASYVVFGTDDALPARVFLDGLNGDDGFALHGTGGSVRGPAGDVDGDGIDDLIIGPYVVFGSEGGFPPIIDLARDADMILQGAYGPVSRAGDVNGDGIDDLIIGRYVVFGSEGGFPPTIDLPSDADIILQGADGPVSGAGDVNGDGIGDLIIGGGISYVVFGSEGGFPAILDLASDADIVLQGAGGPISGAGDLNGDGIDDLLIGDPDASPNGRPGAGVSYVVFGAPADPAAAIEDLIADVEAAGLQHRIENSLTKKLERALDSLERDRIKLAVFRLRAFIRQVRAQRGKKIPEVDADAWIADAEAIIDMLEATVQR